MKTYKVIKKEGVRSASGDLIKEGETFTGSHRSATIQLQIRCKEIELFEADSDKEEFNSSKDPKNIPEYRAAIEALGVEIPEGVTKSADLKELYEKSKADSDKEE